MNAKRWPPIVSGGNGLPSNLARVGLLSNSSRWLGPPAMNRKITEVALAGMWTGLGARGSSTPARRRSAIHRMRDPFSVQTPAERP